jgi:hypothetical protein
MLHASDFINLKFSFRWSDRKQSPEECARTAVEFLKLVKVSLPGFRHWRDVDAEEKKAVPLTKPSLSKLFSRGRRLSDIDGQPLEKQGYKIFLSSSAESVGFVGAYLHFGCFGRGNVNVAVLDAYLTAKKAKSLFTLPRCRKLCEQAVAILQPDEGVLDNLALFKHSQTPSSGWLVYLSEEHARRLPKLPRGVEVRPYKKLGVFLIAADKSFPKVPPTNLKTVQALGKIVDPLVKPPR